MTDRLDDVIGSSVAAVVGIVMLCALVIPVGLDFIGQLSGDEAEYAPLLGVVITMSVIGLIIGVIKFFQNSRRKKEVKKWTLISNSGLVG